MFRGPSVRTRDMRFAWVKIDRWCRFNIRTVAIQLERKL
jgi:hypothetical protein